MTDNTSSYEDLNWILRYSDEGFFHLVASSGTQETVLSMCGKDVEIYDYRDHPKRYSFADVARLVEAHPGRRAYILQNFQYALSGERGQDWDENIKRLNFSRDMLARMDKNIIFCMTEEADARLNREAVDFYAYNKMTLFFSDEKSGGEAEPQFETAWIPEDRSTGEGKIVELDFSLSRMELLSLAIQLGRRARTMAEECRWQDALDLLEKVLRIRENETVRAERTDLAVTYRDFGNVYKAKGEYETALSWHQKALLIREEVLGPDHPDTIQSVCDIGSVYYYMGRYSEALDRLRRGAAALEKTHGPDDTDTANAYDLIGRIYLSIADYRAALVWQKKSLDIRRKIFSEEHPDTATSYDEIGVVYRLMDNHPAALEYNQKALKIREKVYGDNHSDTAISYNNIAHVYRYLANYPAALQYAKKGLSIHQKTKGDNHPFTAKSYHTVASVYARMGNFPAALRYFEKSLNIWLKIPGGHPDIAITYRWMGELSTRTGDYAVALEWYQKALRILIKTLDKGHPEMIRTCSDIASVYKRMGRPTQARLWRRKAEAAQKALDAARKPRKKRKK